MGELRCMDCDSNHIAYKGTSKSKYSFDISTPLMRKQIIESINEKISDFTEEIKKVLILKYKSNKRNSTL